MELIDVSSTETSPMSDLSTPPTRLNGPPTTARIMPGYYHPATEVMLGNLVSRFSFILHPVTLNLTEVIPPFF